MHNRIQNISEFQRIGWLDAVRALAILSVTFNHALSRSFAIYSGTQAEFLRMSHWESLIKALFYVFSRLGVPLFLMITGSLLMDRNYEDTEVVNRFYRHNWWRLFRTTEIWLFIMFVYLQFSGHSVFRQAGLLAAIKKLLYTLLFVDQVTMASMWYMSMILVLYLMIPVMSIALKHINKRVFFGLLSIAIVSGMLIPNINTTMRALGVDKSLVFSLSISDLFSVYFIYVLIGYWLSNGECQGIRTTWVCLAFVTTFLATVLYQYWIYATPSDYYIRYADIGILASSACLFEMIRRGVKGKKRSKKLCTFISKISLGIFFVHICIMEGLNGIISYGGFLRFLILECVSFFGSVAIICIVSKFKKIAEVLFLIS